MKPSNHHHWDSTPVIRWLAKEGRLQSDLDETIRRLGAELHKAGAPVWRLRLSFRTLHPLFTAVSTLWERDSQPIQEINLEHGLETRSSYVGSPLEQIARTGLPLRKRLTQLSKSDHSVYHELRERGATDYFGLPMRFSGESGGVLVFVSDRIDGFDNTDIAEFTFLASMLTPVVEVFRLRRLSSAVAEAYLGARTGQRVLGGQITRGDIVRLEAAILVSDIRGWTELNSRLPPETAVSMANRYFDFLAESIEANGGEILKFLGDGVLAIFPTTDDLDDAGACANALQAALQSLQAAAEADAPLDLEFGVAMHFGDVLYGNIGSATRLDFTVLGQAVNMTARLEQLCSELGQPILFSEDFARRLAHPVKLISTRALKGIKAEQKVYGIQTPGEKAS